MKTLLVQQLEHAFGLLLPSYATAGSAGMDLCAAIWEPIVLSPGARAKVPTGLCVAVPAGHEMQIRSRSGLADNHGIVVLNSPGTIDEDYRGEVKVLVFNAGDQPFRITRGMRIAQAVIAAVVQVTFEQVVYLDDTARGAGGFGSSGL